MDREALTNASNGLSTSEGPSAAASRGQTLGPLWHVLALSVFLVEPGTWIQNLYNRFPTIRPVSFPAFMIYGSVFEGFLFSFLLLGLRLSGISVSEIINMRWRSRESAKWSLKSILLLVTLFALSLVITLSVAPDSQSRSSLPSPRNALDLAIALVAASTVGFVEELIFRGYLMRQFEIWTGSILLSAIVQSTLFTVAHGYHQTVATLSQTFLTGLIFAWGASRYRTLAPVMVAHAVIDASLIIIVYFASRMATG